MDLKFDDLQVGQKLYYIDSFNGEKVKYIFEIIKKQIIEDVVILTVKDGDSFFKMTKETFESFDGTFHRIRQDY